MSHRLVESDRRQDPLETGKTVISGQVSGLLRALLTSVDEHPSAAEPLAAAVVGMALGLTEVVAGAPRGAA